MNTIEAEDYIYKSYLKASQHLHYNDKDSEKRNPRYTEATIKQLCHTPCVVVTGSKGKGSVAMMLNKILQTKFHVGLMTSPHISDFRERIRVDDELIDPNDFVRIVEEISEDIDAIDASIPVDRYISPMGIQTIIALKYFTQKHTLFNVFECGKGAKYDDVNNVIHDFAIINTIFLEHTRELGNTLAEIANDKSFVIRSGMRRVYVGEQSPEAMKVIRQRAKECQVELREYGKDFYCENVQFSFSGMIFDIVIDSKRFNRIQIPLLGEHQAKNCALAMCLCNDIIEKLDYDSIRASLLELKWFGRMEILSDSPFVLLDACINKESCINVKKTLSYLKISCYCLVLGIPNDKDFLGVAKEMSFGAAKILLTKTNNPHYFFSDKQVYDLNCEGIVAQWFDCVEDSLTAARSYKKPIVILGTTSLISEIHNICQNKFVF